jgi:hypothetical protein
MLPVKATIQSSARPVSLTPTDISIAFANNQIQLNWLQDQTDWQLQAQTDASGEGLAQIG